MKNGVASVPVITVETTETEVRVSIPTGELPRDAVQDFIDLVRVEAVARKSQMSAAQVRGFADEINADWWAKNAHRFIRDER